MGSRSCTLKRYDLERFVLDFQDEAVNVLSTCCQDSEVEKDIMRVLLDSPLNNPNMDISTHELNTPRTTGKLQHTQLSPSVYLQQGLRDDKSAVVKHRALTIKRHHLERFVIEHQDQAIDILLRCCYDYSVERDILQALLDEQPSNLSVASSTHERSATSGPGTSQRIGSFSSSHRKQRSRSYSSIEPSIDPPSPPISRPNNSHSTTDGVEIVVMLIPTEDGDIKESVASMRAASIQYSVIGEHMFADGRIPKICIEEIDEKPISIPQRGMPGALVQIEVTAVAALTWRKRLSTTTHSTSFYIVPQEFLDIDILLGGLVSGEDIAFNLSEAESYHRSDRLDHSQPDKIILSSYQDQTDRSAAQEWPVLPAEESDVPFVKTAKSKEHPVDSPLPSSRHAEIVIVSNLASAVQFLDQSIWLLRRFRKAQQRQKALSDRLAQYEDELASVRAIICVINDEGNLHTVAVSTKLVKLKEVAMVLLRSLEEMKSKSRGPSRKFTYQLVEGSSDEIRLRGVMKEMAQVKTSLLLSIQLANVGVMRDVQNGLIANTRIIERVDQVLRKEIEGSEGLRIAQLLKGRRPSNDGTILLTRDDLRALAGADDSDNNGDEKLMDDSDYDSDLPRQKEVLTERITSNDLARDQALHSNGVVEDIWNEIERNVIEDNVASEDAVQINHRSTLEVTLALLKSTYETRVPAHSDVVEGKLEESLINHSDTIKEIVKEIALHRTVETHRSTQADSTVGSTTLVNTQDMGATEVNVPASLSLIKQEVFIDEDCFSVASNDDDIASQAATRRTRPEILAVRQLGAFFADLEDLRPLHEAALARLGPQRFQENYRRILKLYVLKLQNEAHFPVEKDTVAVLRSRMNRLNIAQRVVNLMQGDEAESSKPMDGLTQQPVEKIDLESWLASTYTSDNATIKDLDEQSDDDCESEIDMEERLFPSITQATHFLREGTPFRYLVHELRLLLLPGALKEVIESTSKSDIQMLSTNDDSIVNRIKAFAEDHSALEWDWWPLMPRIPNVPPGKVRLQWTFCGERLFRMVSIKEAEHIRQILEFAEDQSNKSCWCETPIVKTSWRTIFRRTCQMIGSFYKQGTFSSLSTISGSPSKAQQLYTPASVTATVAASVNAQTHEMTPIHDQKDTDTNGTQAPGGPSCANAATQQTNPSWVVFGVQNTADFDEIENIDMGNIPDDRYFFQELKTRHNKHYWLVRRFFSPFRFRHCKFVRFETIDIDQVYSCGEALPEDHGYDCHYEYEPRPPKAKNPLIDRKLFAICLKACNAHCSWGLLPSYLHKCRPLPCGSRIWKRIPRKESAFIIDQSQPGEVAFGLEADYALSFATLFLYHILLLLSAFGFWIYWLLKHPNDLQNASVPTFTIFGLFAAFWGLFARFGGSIT